jgi:hypothetical protein
MNKVFISELFGFILDLTAVRSLVKISFAYNALYIFLYLLFFFLKKKKHFVICHFTSFPFLPKYAKSSRFDLTKIYAIVSTPDTKSLAIEPVRFYRSIGTRISSISFIFPYPIFIQKWMT